MSPKLRSVVNYFIRKANAPLNLEKLSYLVAEAYIDHAGMTGRPLFPELLEYHSDYVFVPEVLHAGGFYMDAFISKQFAGEEDLQFDPDLSACRAAWACNGRFDSAVLRGFSLVDGSFKRYLCDEQYPKGSLLPFDVVTAYYASLQELAC